MTTVQTPLPPTPVLAPTEPVWGPRLRSWVIVLRLLLAALLGAAISAVGVSAAAVNQARSVLLVGVGLACLPLAVAGLAGVWWGVLVACPTLILFDHLLGPADSD